MGKGGVITVRWHWKNVMIGIYVNLVGAGKGLGRGAGMLLSLVFGIGGD